MTVPVEAVVPTCYSQNPIQNVSNPAYIDSDNFAAAGSFVVRHLIFILERIAVGNAADVAKYVLATSVRADETEAALLIPSLDSSDLQADLRADAD